MNDLADLPAPDVADTRASLAPPVERPSYRVAVVDDDALCRNLVGKILAARGHQALGFADAASALQAIVAAVHDEPFDVVVSDLNMPRMQGDEFVRALSRDLGNHAPPLVMVSGSNNEDTVGRALDAGARPFIRKPLSAGELLAVTERAARAADHPTRLRPGARLGEWTIDSELGRGGMGIVYRAADPHGGPDVAIKVLAQSNLDDHLRFRRELDILSALRHPGLTRLLQTGQADGHTFYVMELAPGRSLKHLLHRHGALPPARVAALGAALARTLAYVHDHDVVHRDVKPDNVMVDQRGTPRLIDFGLARRPLDGAVTRHDYVVGTPQYLAPEVLLTGQIRPAADMFALGVTLYETLLGAHPLADHASRNPFAFAHHVEHHGFPPLRERLPNTPAELDTLLARCLDPDPTVRPRALDTARVLEHLTTHR